MVTRAADQAGSAGRPREHGGGVTLISYGRPAGSGACSLSHLRTERGALRDAAGGLGFFPETLGAGSLPLFELPGAVLRPGRSAAKKARLTGAAAAGAVLGPGYWRAEGILGLFPLCSISFVSSSTALSMGRTSAIEIGVRPRASFSSRGVPFAARN
jgi:hypothetical protein